MNKQDIQAKLETLKEERIVLLQKFAQNLLPNLEEDTRDNVCFLFPEFGRKFKRYFDEALAFKPNFAMKLLYGTEQLRTAKFSDDLQYLRSQLASYLDLNPFNVRKIDNSLEFQALTFEIDSTNAILAEIANKEISKIRSEPVKRGFATTSSAKLPLVITDTSVKTKTKFSKDEIDRQRREKLALDKIEDERIRRRRIDQDDEEYRMRRLRMEDSSNDSFVNGILIGSMLNSNSHQQTETVFQGKGGEFDGGGASGDWGVTQTPQAAFQAAQTQNISTTFQSPAEAETFGSFS